MRRTGYLAVAAVLGTKSGQSRLTSDPDQKPIGDTAPPDNQQWPSGLRVMAGWHIALPLQKQHNCHWEDSHWEGSADTLALRKGNPAARRVRKATGLTETAGLPNRGSLCAATSGF